MTCTVTISKAQVLCSVHEFLEEAEHLGTSFIAQQLSSTHFIAILCMQG